MCYQIATNYLILSFKFAEKFLSLGKGLNFPYVIPDFCSLQIVCDTLFVGLTPSIFHFAVESLS